MENRIRVGVLIFNEGKLLLIKHVDPKSGYTWWVPLGGGLKEKETIFECGAREVMEEANLSVKLDKVIYLRQFIYNIQDQNNIDVYITSSESSGKKAIANLKGMGGDEHFIKELKFFSRDEIKDINVFPNFLKENMWQDYDKDFPNMKFLGVEDDSEHQKNI
ncbi:MAG: NUDIX hydrolase [Nanoarchaeota archaeon]|nr:NUDIX hydrolase [Nanoarchaeota archaeon]MBU1320848.1 NUDIX hydrolase [Nanoarchaeota archaeon]MBU1596946.1 NUDIX hydrolase [Nanoarchaeota archaeon]MBU2440761.1 NUDIX hydrolase [Nanoarchaeota archaeon]